MSRDVIGVAPHDSLAQALHLLRRHRIKALPVTDERARVLGIVTQTDLLDKAEWDRSGPRLGLGRRLQLTVERGRAPHGCAADIMSAVEPVTPDTPLAEWCSGWRRRPSTTCRWSIRMVGSSGSSPRPI